MSKTFPNNTRVEIYLMSGKFVVQEKTPYIKIRATQKESSSLFIIGLPGDILEVHEHLKEMFLINKHGRYQLDYLTEYPYISYVIAKGQIKPQHE